MTRPAVRQQGARGPRSVGTRVGRNLLCAALLAAAVVVLVEAEVPAVRFAGGLGLGFGVAAVASVLGSRSRMTFAVFLFGAFVVTVFGAMVLFDDPSAEPLAALLTCTATIIVLPQYLTFVGGAGGAGSAGGAGGPYARPPTRRHPRR